MKQLKITNKITSRETDAIKIYLNEIGKIDLLTEKEEIELAKMSREGDGAAKDKLVKANLRFVVSVSKQYQNQGLTFDDLINEGNIGLIKAAERFDDTKGFKFISYAVWWIRQSILQALADNARMIRLPSNQISTLHKISKASQKFEQNFEREPTNEEMADLIDGDPFKIANILKSKNKHSSLDAPLNTGSEETYSLYDVISSEDDNNIEKMMSEDSMKRDIEAVLGKLKPRQKEIICMYYGIFGYPKMTLEEIGEYFELTRERVRQVKDTAIRILRHRSKSQILRQHLK